MQGPNGIDVSPLRVCAALAMTEMMAEARITFWPGKRRVKAASVVAVASISSPARAFPVFAKVGDPVTSAQTTNRKSSANKARRPQ